MPTGTSSAADDLLIEVADPVVVVVQAVVLDVERVPAESRAVREQDALGAWGGNVDERADPVGTVADVDRL